MVGNSPRLYLYRCQLRVTQDYKLLLLLTWSALGERYDVSMAEPLTTCFAVIATRNLLDTHRLSFQTLLDAYTLLNGCKFFMFDAANVQVSLLCSVICS